MGGSEALGRRGASDRRFSVVSQLEAARTSGPSNPQSHAPALFLSLARRLHAHQLHPAGRGHLPGRVQGQVPRGRQLHRLVSPPPVQHRSSNAVALSAWTCLCEGEKTGRWPRADLPCLCSLSRSASLPHSLQYLSDWGTTRRSVWGCCVGSNTKWMNEVYCDRFASFQDECEAQPGEEEERMGAGRGGRQVAAGAGQGDG